MAGLSTLANSAYVYAVYVSTEFPLYIFWHMLLNAIYVLDSGLRTSDWDCDWD